MNSQIFQPRKLLAFILICIGFLSFSAKGQGTRMNQQVLVPFIKEYCIRCHGAEEQRGDVNFREFQWNVTDDVTAQHWQDVLDVLNSGEMPPEDEKQPAGAKFDKIVKTLTSDLKKAQEILKDSGGAYTIRRLNQREYINTIKHLFGIQVAESFVPDDIRDEHHYDTAEKLQYFDGPLLDQYIEMGITIAEEGIEWSTKPYDTPTVQRHEAESANKDLKKRPIKGYPIDKEGLYMCNGGANHRPVRSISVNHGKDPRAYYKLRVRGAAHDMDAPRRHYLMLRESSAIRSQGTPVLNVLKIHGSRETPSVTEVTVPRTILGTNPKPSLNLSEVMFEGITNVARWFPIYLRTIGSEENRPSVWVDWVELEGPFYDQKSNIFGDLMKKYEGEEKVSDFFKEFCYEAFRQVNPSNEYLKKLEAYYKGRRSSGLKHNDALAQTIGLILASPSFLYIEENNKSNKLDSRSLATRLSYFLWSAPPDTELYSVANKLSEPNELRKQIDRMLTDKRSESFYKGFMSQWAELERLEQISPEWEKFTKFNKGIRYSINQEPVEFFKTLVRENLAAYFLIDSTFITVNAQLAEFYGLPEPHTSSEFIKVPIPASHPRGGLVTQAAFLTMGTVGDRTSPVIRGSLILEKLLNDPPASPPPNVPELGEASDKPLTNRELVELHRKQKVCASCHDKIDPIGYSLENFDPIGLWRDTELVGKKEVPVETSATLDNGKRLKDLRDLQVYIKGQEKGLSRHMVESLLAYGIGRNVQFSDAPEIDNIQNQVTSEGVGMRDLIFHLVNSEIFRGK